MRYYYVHCPMPDKKLTGFILEVCEESRIFVVSNLKPNSFERERF